MNEAFIDSSTINDYSCRPQQHDHTYLTIGQDLFSIQNYVLEQYNASLHRGRYVTKHRYVLLGVTYIQGVLVYHRKASVFS